MDEKPRITRLTAIVTDLQSQCITTAKSLAIKYGVSVRTIYRDIRTLENSGIPIITEEGKGYSLMEGYKLPPVMFTEDEANALITVAQMIEHNSDVSLIENYNNAITKIKSVLQYSQKEKTDLLSDRIWVRNNASANNPAKYLITIQAALTNFQLLDIAYNSLENNFTHRIVEPFAIYSTQGNWLLIAFCRLRNEFRTFRIDLIQQLSVLNDRFEPHKMTMQEYFNICKEKYMKTHDIPLS
ncbi:transcriptional regulator [Neptunitalea chrysea]|uniref:Transcriptional regulator n=1 Tax=Neptunitalea chrysea TaxID=1647581 RepID=A0A9W6B488_9FLAO|nr:YafY family protein [Neptunitalea chrysea]GLB52269.1 transcriptional regulator [Neptunitalea chrysea]